MSGEDIHDVLRLPDLETLRRDNPQQLFQHLDLVRQRFLFGVEDHRDALEEEEEDGGGWGGDFRVTINRNVVLHLVPAFREGMPTHAELPQFCVMPDEDRADRSEEFTATLDGDDTTTGVIFWVDPLDYDVLCREAIQIAEQYPGWDLLPDSYFLDTELVRLIGRTVLEDPHVRAEREYDFRLGLYGGTEPPPLDEEESIPAEELISPDRGEDDEPPLEGMRSHPVSF